MRKAMSVVAMFLIVLLAGGCATVNLEAFEDGADALDDAFRDVEGVVDQTGDTFEETGEATTKAAGAIEATNASFGGESACITPGLNIGPEYSMRFSIPGRELSVIFENGEMAEGRAVHLEHFEVADAHFDVHNFASLMEAHIVVKIYRYGEPHEIIKERIGQRYSKEELTDDSCVPYFVEAKGAERNLTLHNGR